jgi:hypothetical protein
MHIACVHCAPRPRPVVSLPSRTLPNISCSHRHLTWPSRMTQTVSNRGNPGQVRAQKEGYFAGTPLDDEHFGQTVKS